MTDQTSTPVDDFYRPEDAVKAMCSYDRVSDLLHEVCALKDKGTSSPGNALTTVIRNHFAMYPLVGRFGDERALRGIAQCLRLLDGALEHMYKESLFPEERPEVQLQNDARTVDASVLASFLIASDSNYHEDRRINTKNLRSRHARRRLILGMMAFIADACDPPNWVSEDIRHVDSIQRELYGSHLKAIDIVGESSEVDGQKVFKHEVEVFEDAADAVLCQKRIGVNAFRTRMMCREASVGDETYYVYSNARPKELSSTLFKLLRNIEKEPERVLIDARGFMEIVVAIKGADGQLIRATREHADRWAAQAVRNLWASDGMRIEQALVRKSATYGSRKYSSVRNFGRVVRRHDGFLVAGRMEQQIMSIADYIATLGVNEQHHDVYAWTRFHLAFLPRMFPHVKWGDSESARYKVGMRRVMALVQVREGSLSRALAQLESE